MLQVSTAPALLLVVHAPQQGNRKARKAPPLISYKAWRKPSRLACAAGGMNAKLFFSRAQAVLFQSQPPKKYKGQRKRWATHPTPSNLSLSDSFCINQSFYCLTYHPALCFMGF
ncbi:hypothetical protein VTK26DRAFT_6721 [Humicola hyalothermophila]